MPKLTARPVPAVSWTGMICLAIAEPTLVCATVLKIVQASAPGAGERQLLVALLFVLLVALLGSARRGLFRLLAVEANRRPMLLVWTAGICSAVITWHSAAVTHGGDRVFQFAATMVLSTAAAYRYAHLGQRTLLHCVQDRDIVQVTTLSMALLGLGAGGALDHQTSMLGTVLGVAFPIAMLLWGCLLREPLGDWSSHLGWER